MQKRMLLKLFWLPVLLLLSSVLVTEVLGRFVPLLFSVPMFVKLAEGAYWLEGWAGLALFVMAILSAIPPSLQLWRWSQGSEASCFRCGGLVEFRTGRYGPYLRLSGLREK